MSENILFFNSKSEFGWEFSNFAEVPDAYCEGNLRYALIDKLGNGWQTAEHAYQAMKFTDTALREEIALVCGAWATKKIANANKHLIRPDWDKVKVDLMEKILRRKFQHPFFKEKMQSIDCTYVHDSPWDGFWGVTNLSTELKKKLMLEGTQAFHLMKGKDVMGEILTKLSFELWECGKIRVI